MTPQEIKAAKTSDLVALYNKLTGKSIKKFQDRATAEKRVGEAVQETLAKAESTPAAKAMEAASAHSEFKRPSGQPVRKGLPGPNSKMAGKRIYKKVEANPRREGTNGWTSFNAIRSGMTYEEYRLAGGRSNDLAWDIAHGYVEVK